MLAPASWSDDGWIERSVAQLESWGFQVRLGAHARDRRGYLAGRDEDRLADLNSAIRDPEVRAIVCLRGGCGSFRVLHGIDIQALRRDPKPLVGFSDITALHRVWHSIGVPSLHGAVAGAHAKTVRDLLLGHVPHVVRAIPTQFGAELTRPGTASGPLFGGNLELLARTVGVLDFDLQGHVLLLEASKAAGLGMIDRAMTQLIMSGALDGITGIALGCLEGFDDYEDRGWTIIDVLRDRFDLLGVPVLAGLPLGHLADPITVPLSVDCGLDLERRELTCSPAATKDPPDAPGTRTSA
ncbi:LD-carboxypeptidase [Amycolatopsis minnesotensis]|uniref:LD-carboxypeptidase n=1 Tax=Amycolatopsis minnesotensis TaxID=337894 RepID=A0ABN2SG01_9PSEU